MEVWNRSNFGNSITRVVNDESNLSFYIPHLLPLFHLSSHSIDA